MKLKAQGQRCVSNEAEAGPRYPKGAGERLVMGTKLPCCCSLGPMPAPDAVTLLKSASAATSGDVALDLYPQLTFFPGVATTCGAVGLAGHTGWARQVCSPGFFFAQTYSGLKLLNYLEKKFNHERERPMGCFFLHQCNKPRAQKDTRTQDKFCPEGPDSLGILWCVLVKGWR